MSGGRVTQLKRVIGLLKKETTAKRHVTQKLGNSDIQIRLLFTSSPAESSIIDFLQNCSSSFSIVDLQVLLDS